MGDTDLIVEVLGSATFFVVVVVDCLVLLRVSFFFFFLLSSTERVCLLRVCHFFDCLVLNS